MSEYMEKFAVSRLIGAPPGYVGYEGQLFMPGLHFDVISSECHTSRLEWCISNQNSRRNPDMRCEPA